MADNKGKTDLEERAINNIENNHLSDASTENGDVFAGVKYQYNFNFEAPKIEPDGILLLVNQYKDVDCKSEKFLAMKEELDDYNKPRPNRDIIGLNNKLVDGAREDLISEATEYKDKFAKRLSRYEFSSHHSAIHLTLLSKIEERFNSHIAPLIKQGECDLTIDMAISRLIIEPLSQEVAPADPTITAKIVRGMMYLLTGNCYVKWSKK